MRPGRSGAPGAEIGWWSASAGWRGVSVCPFPWLCLLRPRNQASLHCSMRWPSRQPWVRWIRSVFPLLEIRALDLFWRRFPLLKHFESGRFCRFQLAFHLGGWCEASVPVNGCTYHWAAVAEVWHVYQITISSLKCSTWSHYLLVITIGRASCTSADLRAMNNDICKGLVSSQVFSGSWIKTCCSLNKSRQMSAAQVGLDRGFSSYMYIM